jgi:transglutaminase-like putative cysteine protease
VGNHAGVNFFGDSDKVLKLPFRGAPMTVAVMKQAALRSQNHYPVRLLAEEICRHLGGKDYASEALAIYFFVLSHTRYMRDPRCVELIRAPHVLVRELMAGKTPSTDCDDQACLIAALLLATGCEARFATVAFRKIMFQGKPQYSHVFAQAKEPRTGTWLTLDPVAAERTPEMLGRVKQACFWPIA